MPSGKISGLLLLFFVGGLIPWGLPAISHAQYELPPEDDSMTVLLRVDPLYAVYRHIDTGFFKQPMGVFFDRHAHEIYVADTRNDAIAIFNDEGTPVFSFGGVQHPRKVMVDPEGKIYVLDTEIGASVKVFNYRGEYLTAFDFSGFQGENAILPVSMTIDPSGNLYFLDQGNLKVLVYDRDGDFKMSFGAQGNGPGQFSVLADVAVDRNGIIYITDSRGVAVQVFDERGNFIRGWGEHDLAPHQFSHPSGIAIDDRGRVLVADTLRQDIKVFTPEGEFLGHFGGYGTGPGNVAYPVDLEVDERGRIYLVERVGGRLQVFVEVEKN